MRNLLSKLNFDTPIFEDFKTRVLTDWWQRWFTNLYEAFNSLLNVGGLGLEVVAATTIALDSKGNSFTVTGSTTIDNIISTNWKPGSVVRLFFSAAVTIRHNQAADGTPILLSGAANFNATQDDNLTLELITAPSAGALRWMEVGRTVI